MLFKFVIHRGDSLQISAGYIPTSCGNPGRYVFTIILIFSCGVIETGIVNGALIKIIDEWVLQLRKTIN
jgi:hypothetical protein